MDERGLARAACFAGAQLNVPLTYRGICGTSWAPDGSVLPEDTEEPKGLRFLAFVGDLAEAETRPSVVVGMCSAGGEGEAPRVWLTDPVVVEP